MSFRKFPTLIQNNQFEKDLLDLLKNYASRETDVHIQIHLNLSKFNIENADYPIYLLKFFNDSSLNNLLRQVSGLCLKNYLESNEAPQLKSKILENLNFQRQLLEKINDPDETNRKIINGIIAAFAKNGGLSKWKELPKLLFDQLQSRDTVYLLDNLEIFFEGSALILLQQDKEFVGKVVLKLRSLLKENIEQANLKLLEPSLNLLKILIGKYKDEASRNIVLNNYDDFQMDLYRLSFMHSKSSSIMLKIGKIYLKLISKWNIHIEKDWFDYFIKFFLCFFEFNNIETDTCIGEFFNVIFVDKQIHKNFIEVFSNYFAKIIESLHDMLCLYRGSNSPLNEDDKQTVNISNDKVVQNSRQMSHFILNHFSQIYPTQVFNILYHPKIEKGLTSNNSAEKEKCLYSLSAIAANCLSLFGEHFYPIFRHLLSSLNSNADSLTVKVHSLTVLEMFQSDILLNCAGPSNNDMNNYMNALVGFMQSNDENLHLQATSVINGILLFFAQHEKKDLKAFFIENYLSRMTEIFRSIMGFWNQKVNENTRKMLQLCETLIKEYYEYLHYEPFYSFIQYLEDMTLRQDNIFLLVSKLATAILNYAYNLTPDYPREIYLKCFHLIKQNYELVFVRGNDKAENSDLIEISIEIMCSVIGSCLFYEKDDVTTITFQELEDVSILLCLDQYQQKSDYAKASYGSYIGEISKVKDLNIIKTYFNEITLTLLTWLSDKRIDNCKADELTDVFVSNSIYALGNLMMNYSAFFKEGCDLYDPVKIIDLIEFWFTDSVSATMSDALISTYGKSAYLNKRRLLSSFDSCLNLYLNSFKQSNLDEKDKKDSMRGLMKVMCQFADKVIDYFGLLTEALANLPSIPADIKNAYSLLYRTYCVHFETDFKVIIGKLRQEVRNMIEVLLN